MYRIKLSTSAPEWPLQRQTPGQSGIWGNCQFFIDTDVDECDFWVVHEDLPASEKCLCPPQNTLLITGEPPSVKTYAPEFLRQFANIITCSRQIHTNHVIYSHISLPWRVGEKRTPDNRASFTKDYDELCSIQKFEKRKLLSVITSNKKFTRGHLQRIDFVNRLKLHFGSNLDVFGRGIHDIDDKWDAIADYKYHIALENCIYPDYWTEKLGDAYLGGAFPIYYGCPNLADYFPAEAFIPISYDFEDAVAIIQKTIDDDHFDCRVPVIERSRKLVLDEYNIFPRLHAWVNQAPAGQPKEPLCLRPAQQCASLAFKVGDKIRRKINRYI